MQILLNKVYLQSVVCVCVWTKQTHLCPSVCGWTKHKTHPPKLNIGTPQNTNLIIMYTGEDTHFDL